MVLGEDGAEVRGQNSRTAHLLSGLWEQPVVRTLRKQAWSQDGRVGISDSRLGANVAQTNPSGPRLFPV